jgi:hypothetical protein
MRHGDANAFVRLWRYDAGHAHHRECLTGLMGEPV